jgi:hypothetical protein
VGDELADRDPRRAADLRREAGDGDEEEEGEAEA